MNVFKYNIALYVYLFIAISLGWYYNHISKSYVEKYDVMIMLLIETIIVFFCVALYLAYEHKLKPMLILHKLKKISFNDYIIFTFFAIYGVFASFIGLKFLKYHDVSKMRISDFIITIPISALGLYYFSEEKITGEKAIGLIAVLTGGYLFMK